MAKDKTFCSLYTFVKEHNPKLYELLEDMCAVGLFRPRFPTTFLNPGSDLVKKLNDLINEGESEKAFHQLQKLFIHGKHTSLKGELVTNGRNVVSDDLSSLKQDGNFKHWESRDNTIVYVYNEKEFPKVGKETVPIPKTERKAKGKGETDGGFLFGSSSTTKCKATDELFKNNKNDLQKEAAFRLNSLLTWLQNNGQEDLSNKLKNKLDPNLALSWYLIVQPKNNNNPYISKDIFEQWYPTYSRDIISANLITNTFSNINNSDDLRRIQETRKNLVDTGFTNYVNDIKNAYEGDNLRLLEDELRFRYSDEEIDQGVKKELDSINWDDPSKSLILVRPLVSSSCSLYQSYLFKLMKEFVNSSAFLYTILNDKLIEKFNKFGEIGGAGNVKMISILGSNYRSFIGGLQKIDPNESLTAFIGGLNSEQKNILKSLLN